MLKYNKGVKIKKFYFTVFCFLGFSSIAMAEVQVSYIHNSVRCATCYRMEKWSSEAAADLNVSYQSIDTDIKENEHYLQDYSLYTKSLVISDTESGKWKNLDKIWQLSQNETEFKNYIKQEVETFMKAK